MLLSPRVTSGIQTKGQATKRPPPDPLPRDRNSSDTSDRDGTRPAQYI